MRVLSGIRGRYLTRRPEDLNYAWRELTRVQTTLVDCVLPCDRLAMQADACREEAYRLAVAEDGVVSELLQQLAESVDETGADAARCRRVRRLLRAVYERFNTIRTARIHQQHVNIRSYRFALWALILLSAVLIDSAHLLLPADPDAGAAARTVAVQPAPEAVRAAAASDVLDVVVAPLRDLLATNVLAFVFLGGLVGGFLSVAARARNRDREPGEDAYVTWYVLTKPLVGAVGAIVLFSLMQGGLFSTDLIKSLPLHASPEVFGFAFIAGFSERLVFPKFN